MAKDNADNNSDDNAKDNADNHSDDMAKDNTDNAADDNKHNYGDMKGMVMTSVRGVNVRGF